MNLAYDPLGRLWQVSSSSGTTQFLYDGDHEALEYDGNGAILWRYFFGPGADEPIVADQGGRLDCNNTRFLHVDHEGSMIATNDCSGNRATVATYDEYGIPGASNAGRFQYTGQAYIPEIGMYYYKARIYSPTLGRFLQTDSIGYDGGINIYEYALDDPVDHDDPSGNDCSSNGGMTTCTTPAYSVSFPTPQGFDDPRSGQENYHFYSEPAQSALGLQPTRNWLVNNPTPAAINNPASPRGTVNDATPGIGGLSPVKISPVISLTTTNAKDGQPAVVNVTLPGHPLQSGIVVREAQANKDGTTTIQNWGEGNSSLQKPGSSVGNEIDSVWKSQAPPGPNSVPPPSLNDLCAEHPGAC